LRHIAGYRDVVFVFFNGFVVRQLGKILYIGALGKRLQYLGAVFIAEFVFVSSTDKFGCRVNEQCFIVLLAFFELR
jgi:hypothetical protein